MTGPLQRTLIRIEEKFTRGDLLDGAALKAKGLLGDLSVAGYAERDGGRPAAVLIPVIRHERGLRLFFTKRPDTLKEHAGQISFPGGRQEMNDSDIVSTALREAREEIGLRPELVSVIGRLGVYRTITRYQVTPVIGLVEGGFTPNLDPREVEAVFDAPLEFFLDRANLKQRSRLHEGRERPYYYFDYRDFHIWGATAAMLVNFREALFAYAKD